MYKLFPSHDKNLYLMGLSSVIADIRLILEGNQLYYYIDILVSL